MLIYFEITSSRQTSLSHRRYRSGEFNHVPKREGECVHVSVAPVDFQSLYQLHTREKRLIKEITRSGLLLEQKPTCTQVLSTVFNNPTFQ